MRYLRRDKRGEIIGLPLELIAVALVMAMVIPSVYLMSVRYKGQSMEDILLDELGKFKRAAHEVNRLEEGNIRAVKLSISALSEVEYVRCGGENPWHIRYKMRGSHENYYPLGLKVSNVTGGGFFEIDLPMDGTVILLSRSDTMKDLIEVRIGDV